MSELEVKPIKSLNLPDDDNDYHENLPKISRNNGSLIIIVAPTSSGKTTLINNLLYNKNMWGRNDKRPNGAFDGVYLWSPSIYLDESSRFIIQDFIVSDSFKNEDLEEIKRNQLLLPKEDRGKLLLVIDDSVGLDVMKSKSALTYYATRFRHLNCSVICSVQNYRACNSIVRNNCNCLIMMYGIYNQKELEKLNDEVGDVYRQTLMFCSRKYCNKKFMFLTLYPREVPARMLLNFTTEINYKQHVKEAKNFNFTDYESDDDGGVVNDNEEEGDE